MRNKHVSSTQKPKQYFHFETCAGFPWFHGGRGGCGVPGPSSLNEVSLVKLTPLPPVRSTSPPSRRFQDNRLFPHTLSYGSFVSPTFLHLSSLRSPPPSPPSWGSAGTFSDTSNRAITLEATAPAREGSAFLTSPDSLL